MITGSRYAGPAMTKSASSDQEFMLLPSLFGSPETG